VLDRGLLLLGLGFSESTRCSNYIYEGKDYEQGGLDWDGFGLLASVSFFLLSPLFLFL
jgi:hypothetical protein